MGIRTKIEGMTDWTSTTNFSHGPTVTLSIPKYNPGTTYYKEFYARAMALPTGDFLFVMLAIGMGAGGGIPASRADASGAPPAPVAAQSGR